MRRSLRPGGVPKQGRHPALLDLGALLLRQGRGSCGRPRGGRSTWAPHAFIHWLVGLAREFPPSPLAPCTLEKRTTGVVGGKKMTPALPPKSLLNAFERLVIFRRQGGVKERGRSQTCLFETSRPRTSLPCPRPTCGARLCSRSSWARREGRHWMLGQRGHSPRPGAMQMLAWKG